MEGISQQPLLNNGAPVSADSHEQQLLLNSAPAFADAEPFQQEIRRQTSVEDLHSDPSLAQSIARHEVFNSLTNVVIFAFLVYTGAFNGHSKMLSTIDHLFLAFFGLRWLVRFPASPHDCWLVYDSIIVVLMVVEQCMCHDNLRKQAYLRAGQVIMLCFALLGALTRKVPQLMVLIKGLTAVLRSVFFILILFSVALCSFGLVLERATQNTVVGETYFESLPAAMYTLLVHGVLLDHVAEVGDAIDQESRLLAAFFFMFIFLAIPLPLPCFWSRP